jgi:hypothetical protein
MTGKGWGNFLAGIVPCDQIKKIRLGENGGLNQSKHQNSTIQVTRFFLIDRTLQFSLSNFK